VTKISVNPRWFPLQMAAELLNLPLTRQAASGTFSYDIGELME